MGRYKRIYKLKKDDITRIIRAQERRGIDPDMRLRCCRCGFEFAEGDNVVSKTLKCSLNSLYEPFCAIEKGVVLPSEVFRAFGYDPGLWMVDAEKRVKDFSSRVEMVGRNWADEVLEGVIDDYRNKGGSGYCHLESTFSHGGSSNSVCLEAMGSFKELAIEFAKGEDAVCIIVDFYFQETEVHVMTVPAFEKYERSVRSHGFPCSEYPYCIAQHPNEKLIDPPYRNRRNG